MPGILPMKIIKFGTNSQSRIAQACDRCRSKKIRCDGTTPCCMQCKNVGFKCETTDKLSRRAFPRCYTESLEEKVRTLEAEIRVLKGLVDERNEKIDLLSNLRSFSPTSRQSLSNSSPATTEVSHLAHSPNQDSFSVRQVPFLQEREQKSDPLFIGTSSTIAWFEIVKYKIQESRKAVTNVEPDALFGSSDLVRPAKCADPMKNIPCIVSDQLINIFFQEWSPLFPVLHCQTFLDIHKTYESSPELIKDPVSVAQLNLVFGTAALANESNKDSIPYFESKWQEALGAVIDEIKLSTLQCIILAQIYCMAKGDYNKLLYYTSIGVNLSHRLGLNQSQERFSLEALTRETRKKVFWTLYTLDAFAAATLGLPKLLKDEDIETEDPADVDDENVSKRGFRAMSRGNPTDLSSALALFRAARILSKVLNELYPAKSCHELSLQGVSALNDELDAWRKNLAPHLRLEFVQDKPSANFISSRSPLLALAYFHIRSLIHRPFVNVGLNAQAQKHIFALADSSKRILQIIRLLNERHMSYTMCINKTELTTACGFGLILQMLDLPMDSKIFKNTQQSLASLMETMKLIKSPAASAFEKLINPFPNIPDFVKPDSHRSSPSSSRQRPSQDDSETTEACLQAIATEPFFNSARPSKLKMPHAKQESNSFGDLMPYTVANNLALYAPVKESRTSLSFTSSKPVPKSMNSQTSNPPVLPSTKWNNVSDQELSSVPYLTPHGKNLHQDILDSRAPFPYTLASLNWGNGWAGAGNRDLNTLDVQDPSSFRGVESVLSISDRGFASTGEEFSTCDLGSEYWGYQFSVNDYKRDGMTTH